MFNPCYFQFLRIVVTAAAAYVACVEWERIRGWNTWVAGFVGLALLFNPILPVHLNKVAWRFIDPASASVFVAYWWFMRARKGLLMPIKFLLLLTPLVSVECRPWAHRLVTIQLKRSGQSIAKSKR